jgi:hypothetical protein
MRIEKHIVNNLDIAELVSDDLIILDSEDGLDLLGNLYYQVNFVSSLEKAFEVLTR